MKRRVLVHGALLVVAAVLSTAQSQESKFSLAEAAAKDYMTAFFHGDISKAASLTHPDTLQRMRTLILGELDGSLTPEDLGLQLSVDEVRELGDQEFYVALVEADRSRTPDAAAAMRTARVEVINSREAQDGAIAVQLRLLTPSRNGGFVAQEAEFILRSSGTEWKVVADETQQ